MSVIEDSPTLCSDEGTPKKRPRKTCIKILEMNTPQEAVVDLSGLQQLHARLVSISNEWTAEILIDCSARIRQILDCYLETNKRENLVNDLEKAVDTFAACQDRNELKTPEATLP